MRTRKEKKAESERETKRKKGYDSSAKNSMGLDVESP